MTKFLQVLFYRGEYRLEIFLLILVALHEILLFLIVYIAFVI